MPDTQSNKQPSIRSNNTVRCPLCGERRPMLRRHLRIKHGMSADEFREKFKNYPLVSRSQQALKRSLFQGKGMKLPPKIKRRDINDK